MKSLKRSKSQLSVHPFLFAIFPVLFFYSHNISELFLNVVFIPLTAVILLSALLFLLFNFFFRNQNKASILVSIFLLLFFSYGRAQNIIGDLAYTIGTFIIGADKILFPIWIGILLLSTFFLARTRKNLHFLTNFLNVTAIFLIVIPLVNIASYELKSKRISLSHNTGNQEAQTDSLSTEKTDIQPDIYYLIFDRYAGNSTLKEFYNYDNNQFTNYLKSEGFYVATESRANYGSTFLSLASSLNTEFLDYLTEKYGQNSSDRTPVYPMLQDHKVWRFLKEQGYKYIHLGSEWEPTRINKYADVNYTFTEEVEGVFTPNEFSAKLLETTMIAPIREKVSPEKHGPGSKHRYGIQYNFDKLAEIPSIRGPKFVFAHTLIPHEPYVLDSNCNPIKKRDRGGKDEVKYYINQLECANKKIIRLVDQILSKSKSPPIIIIQADEGPHPIRNKKPNNGRWDDAGEKTLREKFVILNAYHLPNADENVLYPSITPVNTFRVIFNTYFGTDYKLLSDKSYVYQDGSHVYKFTDVTDKVN